MTEIQAVFKQLSSEVSRRQIHADLYKYFKDYLVTERNNDSYFDCSEVSDDFLAFKTKGASVYNIRPTNKKFMVWFEFYKPVRIMYHYVYVYNGVAYDPRLNTEPILWEHYKQLIAEYNRIEGVNLTYDLEVGYN